MDIREIRGMLKLPTHKQLSIYLHIFFWVSYLALLGGGMLMLLPPLPSMIRTMIHIFFQMAMVYIHFRFILPRYFEHKVEHKKPFQYIQQALILLVLITGLRLLSDLILATVYLDIPPFTTEVVIPQEVLQEEITTALAEAPNTREGLKRLNQAYFDYWLMENLYSSRSVGRTFLSSLMIFVLSGPLWFFDRWQKQQQEQQEMKSQKLDAELKFLKTQIHPHFLFNTLNNIYTLFIVGSEKAASMILKLSDIMRYMLYECNEEKMALIQEIQYLKNYISLQQLKTEEQQQIIFDVKGPIHQINIPPLLFVPLFENAFKHGNVENTKEGWLTACMEVTADRLSFEIHNSISEHKNVPDIGGIGLENLKQRLLLIYPNKHQFSIKALRNSYSVFINIDLS